MLSGSPFQSNPVMLREEMERKSVNESEYRPGRRGPVWSLFAYLNSYRMIKMENPRFLAHFVFYYPTGEIDLLLGISRGPPSPSRMIPKLSTTIYCI